MLRKEARPPGVLRSLLRRVRVVSVVFRRDLRSVGTRGMSIWRLGPEPPFSEPGISGVIGRLLVEDLVEELVVESVGGRAGSVVTGAVVLVSADIACSCS